MTVWSAHTAPDAASRLFRLDGRIALVTGASRGLGLEMAAALASAGSTVLVNSRDAAKAERIASEFRETGLAGEALPFDPADEQETIEALARAGERHGRIDILIANAAARMRRRFEAITPMDFAGLIDTNLLAVQGLCWHAMPYLKRSTAARVILISSISARRSLPSVAAYATSKGGIEALMRAIAVEYGPLGMTCNAIAPGPFLTEINEDAARQIGAAIAETVPLGRFADPRELAGTVLFLASDAASFVDGQTLIVDGGATAAL